MKFLYGFIVFFQVIANLPSMNIMEKVYKLKKNKMLHRWLEPLYLYVYVHVVDILGS